MLGETQRRIRKDARRLGYVTSFVVYTTLVRAAASFYLTSITVTRRPVLSTKRTLLAYVHYAVVFPAKIEGSSNKSFSGYTLASRSVHHHSPVKSI